MKKKLALLLALVMVVATFGMVLAACNKGPSEESLNSLLAEVSKYHRGDPQLTNTNYTLIGKISTITDDGEVEANVSWKSSSDKVTISSEMNGAGFYTVTIPDRLALTEDLNYTITGTLVDADGKEYKDSEGKTYSVSFDRTVTVSGAAHATLTFDSIIKATTGENDTDQYGNDGFKSITWQENDITFFNDKDTSYSACTIDYVDPARIYAYSKVEISYVRPIKSIKLETQSSYEQGLDGVTVEGGNVQRAETTIIITMDQPTDKVTFIPKKQIRIYTVDVYTADAEQPVLPQVDDTVYETEEEIIAALKQLEQGKTLSNGHEYTLTGTISSIDSEYSTEYKNITVTIEVGAEKYAIQCYGMKGGEELKIGDVITVTGVLKNYNGKIEFDKPTYVAGEGGGGEGGGSQGGEDPDPATHPSAPASDSAFTVLSQPAAGTYKLAMKGQDGSWHYITGEMSTYYYETVTDAASAADVELVADGNGWLLKCGSKYIEIELNGTHINAVYKDARTADKHWTWDSVSGAFVWEDGANKYFLGNHDSYTSIGGCDYTNHADNYMAVLGTPGSGSQGGGDEGGGSTGGDVTPTGNVIKITGDALGLSGKYSDGSKAVNGVTVNWKELMLGNSNYAGAIQVRIEKAKDESGNQAKDDNGNPIKKEGGGVSEIWAECGKKIEKIELVIKGSAFDNEACWLIKFGTGTNYTSTQTLNTVKGTTTYTITPDGDYTSFDLVYNWLKNTGYYAEINIYLAD